MGVIVFSTGMHHAIHKLIYIIYNDPNICVFKRIPSAPSNLHIQLNKQE